MPHGMLEAPHVVDSSFLSADTDVQVRADLAASFQQVFMSGLQKAISSPAASCHSMSTTAANVQVRADLAASFQRVAIAHLTERCKRACTWAKESHPDLQSLVVAGGVACNQSLRAGLAGVTEEAGMQLVCPPPQLCTDNGVMVAWAGVERYSCWLCC